MSTISEVAKAAGVSVATVSRVINRAGTVSPGTAERVREAIDHLKYQPNVWGRSLRRKESRTLLVFVPNVSNPYYSSIISGIEDEARRAGYSTMLCITNMENTRRTEFFGLLSSGQADGAILLDTPQESGAISELSHQFPLVQCCEYCLDETISRISINNEQAAADIVTYLLSLGHRRIGLVSSTNALVSTRQRQEGYQQVLAAAALGGRADYIAFADNDYSFLSGVRAAAGLLALPQRPTALFCVSDVLALGAMRAAEAAGLRVPEDLTIVGFDDVVYATMFHPMLTTVSQPCYDLGHGACALLLRQLGGLPRPEHVFLPHKLILRDSSAPCAVES